MLVQRHVMMPCDDPMSMSCHDRTLTEGIFELAAVGAGALEDGDGGNPAFIAPLLLCCVWHLVSPSTLPLSSNAFRFPGSPLTLTLNVTPSRRRASFRSTSLFELDFAEGEVAQTAGSGACSDRKR